MEVKVNNKVTKRRWNKRDWTPEMDAALRRLADGENSIPEIAVGLQRELGQPFSKTFVNRRMHALNLPMRRRGGQIIITDEMRDFVYALSKKDMTIEQIRERFNAHFAVDWNASRIYRVMLNAFADRSQRLNKTQFAEDWTRMQAKLAPDGEICRKNWLWRWKRLDENRTAAGVVFHGKKVDIPDIKPRGGVSAVS